MTTAATEPAQYFKIAIGEHVGAVEPGKGFDPQVNLTRDELTKLFTAHDPRPSKDGRYFSRPMGSGGRRSDANAESWSLVPVDIDELQADEFPRLLKWIEESNLAAYLWTTYSHAPEVPKVRLMLIASRPVTAEEHAYVHRALEGMVPFKIDPAMAKPSQPVFLPSCPPEHAKDAMSKEFRGRPLDIDRLIVSFKKEMEEETEQRASHRHDARGIGVRQPGGLIEWFNENYDLADLLQQHGYKRRSNRFIAPGSKSKRAAVVLYEGKRLVSFHNPAHDPLAVHNKQHQARVLDAFAAYCVIEHGNDFTKAFAGALSVAKDAGWVNDSAHTIAAAKPKPKAARDLMKKKFDPLRWTIQDILPEGCYLLSARPKVGKSWLGLQFCVAITENGSTLGKRAAGGSVLYLALEDNERRFQARLAKHEIGQYGDIDKFFYETEWSKVGEGGEEALEEWLRAHEDARLVVVDSLEKIRPRRTRDVYADDYAATQALKALSDKYKVTILIICHNRKGKSETGDPLELINASFGLAGGCDGALVIERPRGKSDANFYVIGRDIEHEPEDGYVIRFNRESCKWEMVGESAALANTEAQRSVLDAIREAGKPLTAAQVGKVTDRSHAAARYLLNELADAGKLIVVEDSRPHEYELPGEREGEDA